MEDSKVNVFFIDGRLAIQSGDFPKLKEIVSECPECLKCTNLTERSLLHVAARKGTPEMVEYLVNAGMDIDAVVNEFTPMVSAIYGEKTDNVKKLIALGADLDAEESVYNPLMAAILENNTVAAKLLIDAGMDLTIQYATRDEDWWDVLSYAKYYKNQKVEQMIAEKMKADGIIYDEIEPLTADDFEEEPVFDDYLEEYLGEIDTYFEDDEILKAFWNGEKQVKNDVEIYINVIMPDETHDYVTLVTEGMSNEPMVVTAEGGKYAELIMKLPKDWKTGEDLLLNSKYNWPLLMMSKVAYLPHIFKDSYINEKTIIPYGIPNSAPKYFDIEREFTSVMLCRSEEIPPYEMEDGEVVDFFTLIPITEEEKELVVEQGSQNIRNMLPNGDIVDMDREYLVPSEE